MMRKTFLTSALDMPEIMSYIYNKSWKLQFSASSSIIIIEDFYLQTFLHSLTMQEAISAPTVGGIVRRTQFIIRTTILIEIIGAVLLAPVF